MPASPTRSVEIKPQTPVPVKKDTTAIAKTEILPQTPPQAPPPSIYEPQTPPMRIAESGEIEDDDETFSYTPGSPSPTHTASTSTSVQPKRIPEIPTPLNKQPSLDVAVTKPIDQRQQQHPPPHHNKQHQQQQQQQRMRGPQGQGNFHMFPEPIRRWYPLRIKLEPPKRSRLDAAEQKEFLQFHAKFKNRVKLTNEEVRFYKKYLVSSSFCIFLIFFII